MLRSLLTSGEFSLQAVDVVGQAGKPKSITGFQTHTTPVLLAYGERAELATDECILFTLITQFSTFGICRYLILRVRLIFRVS